MYKRNQRTRTGALIVSIAAAGALLLTGCAVEVKHGDKGGKKGIHVGSGHSSKEHHGAADTPAPGAVALPAGSACVGEAITAEQKVTLANVRKDPGSYLEQVVLVEADAQNVCQVKGCWMTVTDGDGDAEPIWVRWSSGCGGKYAFPKDAGGRRVLVQGTLSEKEITAEAAEHYASESDGLVADDIRGKTFEINATAFAMLPEDS